MPSMAYPVCLSGNTSSRRSSWRSFSFSTWSPRSYHPCVTRQGHGRHRHHPLHGKGSVRFRGVPCSAIDVSTSRSGVSSSSSASSSSPPSWCAPDPDVKLPPCLSGNFAPVVGDLTLPEPLKVKSKNGHKNVGIPADLDGVYMRNGPNWSQEPIYPQNAHWFDGDGMVHYVRIENGVAEYGRRYIRTRGWEEEQAASKAVHVGMKDLWIIPDVFYPRLAAKIAQAVQHGAPDAPFWVVQNKNVANNGLVYHAGRLLATWEAGWAYELSTDGELASRGLCDFNGTARDNFFRPWRENFSAHSKTCPVTGELIYHGYSLIGPPNVMLGVVDAETGSIEHRVTVPTTRATLQHDLAITGTRTIILDQPLVFNQPRALEKGRPFDFDANEPIRYGIIPRRGNAEDVVWIEEPAPSTGFAFHVVNCWDDPQNDDRIVLYTSRMPETCALGMAESNAALSTSANGSYDASVGCKDVGHLHRTVLDVKTRSVVESVRVGDIPSDFPTISPHVVGQPSRYAYSVVPQDSFLNGSDVAVHGDDAIPLFDKVLKHDLASGTVASTYKLPAGRVCGDIIFKSKSECSSESVDVSENGYVLVLSHAVDADASFLEVVDGATLQQVCEIEIPVRIPFGFHCAFLPAEVLSTWRSQCK